MNVVLMIKYKKIHKQHNIHNNNLFQHILMDQMTQMLAILVLLVVIQQGLSYLQLFVPVVTSQTFFMFVMQCALALLFGLNGMTSVFDILIKILPFSQFTLILETFPKLTEFECNNSDDNDGIVIASNIYQSNSAGVGVGLFLAAIYSITQVIVGLSLIIAVSTGIAAFSALIAELQLNFNVEASIGVIYSDSGVIQDSCYFFCNVFSFFSVFFEFVNVVLRMKYNIHHNNHLQQTLMNKFIQILVLFNEIRQGLLYLQLSGPVIMSQTFFVFGVQCELVLFVFSGMATVFDTLVKISFFTLNTNTLPIVVDEIDSNLAKLSEFECNSSDNNDKIITARDIHLSEGTGAGLEFFWLLLM